MEQIISIFKPQNAVSLAATPGTGVWTPATGKRFRLMRLLLTSSVTGNIVLTDGSGGSVLAVIPIVTGTPAVPFDFGYLGVLSGAIDRVLYALNSASAATISGMLEGAEQAF